MADKLGPGVVSPFKAPDDDTSYRCTERYSFGAVDVRCVYGTEYKPTFWDRYGGYIKTIIWWLVFVGFLGYLSFIENADKGVRVLPL